MKKATIGAALLGLLFVGAAIPEPQDPSSRAPESMARKFRDPDVPLFMVSPRQEPPKYRDVLREKVGQRVLPQRKESDVWVLYFGPNFASTNEHTLVAVGEDFVQLRNDREDLYVPLSRVEARFHRAGK